jgi:hypothetical protein
MTCGWQPRFAKNAVFKRAVFKRAVLETIDGILLTGWTHADSRAGDACLS